MLSKSKLATLADFTAKVLLDRESQTGYVRGIVEFPNRLSATDGPETVYAPVVTIVADEFRLSRTEALLRAILLSSFVAVLALEAYLIWQVVQLIG